MILAEAGSRCSFAFHRKLEGSKLEQSAGVSVGKHVDLPDAVDPIHLPTFLTLSNMEGEFLSFRFFLKHASMRPLYEIE